MFLFPSIFKYYIYCVTCISSGCKWLVWIERDCDMARQTDYCLAPVVTLNVCSEKRNNGRSETGNIRIPIFFLRTLTSVTEFCFKPKYFHVSAVACDASTQLIKTFIYSCTPFNIILVQPPLRLLQVTYDVE